MIYIKVIKLLYVLKNFLLHMVAYNLIAIKTPWDAPFFHVLIV